MFIYILKANIYTSWSIASSAINLGKISRGYFFKETQSRASLAPIYSNYERASCEQWALMAHFPKKIDQL